MISPVQSRDREGSPGVEGVLRWEGFVEKLGFEPGVKEWRMMRVVMMTDRQRWADNDDCWTTGQ